ncbi:hypothetical protein [Shewanella sedimentimangrovi]|uniref:Glycosyl transferase family 28 C-terminal domain-containing protein n=1 Tax=Shewanella sedimentimangrovi TaxID=2814293 RepID=A0ABX7R1N2_9GAMM|nr:hypothetical protein [Shewanella sedimentimangrovi]QSX37384.1 hypothetical protein JYB85_00555 [Shewanella sedimentimangrovi]
MRRPKLLFIPVSSAEGIGEYMRSMIIAEGVKRRWPEADIHFILSREAPYANTCPFKTHQVARSPTKEVAAVNRLMAELKPNIVIFDASGRRSQLACAKRNGAAVVFISQHKRKRARGMKWSRARHTDRHWVAQPSFAIEPLSRWERFKLKLLGLVSPRHLGMVFMPPDEARRETLQAKWQLQHGQYLLVNAGSGGHKLGVGLAADIFADAAAALARELGIRTVMIYGDNYPKQPVENDDVVAIKSLNNEDFISLLSGAKAAILSGGGTVLQAIALGVPVLGVPVAKDQPARLQACEAEGLIKVAASETLVESARAFIQPQVLQQLSQALASQSQGNGLQQALADIAELLAERANQ